MTFPATGILSNGRYTVWLTPEGTGVSLFDSYALTPWSLDPAARSEGILFFVRDRESGSFWAIGRPLGDGRESLRSARRQPGVYRIDQQTDLLAAELAVCVHGEFDAELRALRIRNIGERIRRIDVTSYAEVALDRPAAHRAHPAFSRLFIETFASGDGTAVLARRRPRRAGEEHPWLVHAVSGSEAAEFETDRARFVGRGDWPGLTACGPLAGTVGAPLDTILCLRRILSLRPGEETRIVFLMGVAPSREAAVERSRIVKSDREIDRAYQTAAATESARFAAPRLEDHLALAGAILRDERRLRADPAILRDASGSRHELIELGLDPEKPLLLLEEPALRDHDAAAAWAELLRIWGAMGVPIATVALADDPARAARELGGSADRVRILPARSIPSATRALLAACARCVAAGPPPRGETLAIEFPADRPVDAALAPETPASSAPDPRSLTLENGYGGFRERDGAFLIRIDPSGRVAPAATPQPWVNVIANDRLGMLVSERGSCTTWSRNSREHRLTPWSNDPLLDPTGEAFYLRDDETGAFWSAWPGPRGARAVYEIEHTLGESACTVSAGGLESRMALFVAAEDPVQFARLTIRNLTARRRRVSLFDYRRLVLGDLARVSGRFVVTCRDAGLDALLAQNPAAGEFADGVAFEAILSERGKLRHFTTDAAEFLGPHADPVRPASIAGESELSGRTGAGLDSCFVHEIALDLEGGGSAEVAFLFGEGIGREEAGALLDRYRRPGAIEAAQRQARRAWSDLTGRLTVRTPDAALDFLVNGWLLYQDLSCRMRGRTAFYQSGGAYGFRDQLQDASAFLGIDPDLVRRQILLHAGHQFVEGDVLHWWHPPGSRGIRTRFADDLLWLPYVTTDYIRATGDRDILEERARFLQAPALAPGEDEVYLLPETADSGTLYDHCCRAIDRSIATGLGAHGLPLFGTGDWNDGMSRVGREGRGESVWMGFFLFAVLEGFEGICGKRGDSERAETYAAFRGRLAAALEREAWDGDWYLRGFYDNGEPLGSKRSDECRIDALVQAWSVLSGAAPRERAERAIASAEERLVSEKDGIIRLLDPPFSETPNDPGYIKGYLPGIRENGGQYTHAALWLIRALAELRRNDRVARLLAIIHPHTHAATRAQADHYRLEPYVVAADVYGSPPHVGRGGWSWYTGSAGWMYRVAVESLLGVRLRDGARIEVSPCIPDEWAGYDIDYQPPGCPSRFHIEVRNPQGRARSVVELAIDGKPCAIENGKATIPLRPQPEVVRVAITLG